MRLAKPNSRFSLVETYCGRNKSITRGDKKTRFISVGYSLVKQVSYFEDVALQCLQCLDNIYQYDNLQRSKFYRNLPQIVNRLHKACSTDKIFCFWFFRHTINSFPD